MNTDTTDMLSEHLPFRVNDQKYNKAFPQDTDILLLVLSAPTPEQAYFTTNQLVALLKKDKNNFLDVYAPSVEDFFGRNGLLYEDIPQLEHTTDQIVKAQPLIAQITGDPTLHRFITLLTQATDELNKGQQLELGPVFKGVSETINAQLVGQAHPLSWQLLFQGEPLKDSYQEIIVVKPVPDYSALLPSKHPIMAVRTAAEKVGVTDSGPIQLQITGDMALADSELESSLDGMEIALVVTLILVSIILYSAMYTVGMAIAVLICLIVGLIFTAAFATVAIGEVNIISIAFAVLYIGLGVDFAIHFLLRYQEKLENGLPAKDAIRCSGGEVGVALASCTVANAIGFYAFIPTSYSGVAELGVIAGTGMLISLLVTFIIGPALLPYLSKSLARAPGNGKTFANLLKISLQWRKSIHIIAILMLLLAVMLLPQIRFDYNLLNMHDQSGEAVQAFRELLTSSNYSPWYAVVLTEKRDEIQQLKDKLNELPEVSKVVSIQDFVPSEQNEKLAIIEEMALIIGPELSMRAPSTNKQPISQQQQTLTTLSVALEHFIINYPAATTIDAARALKNSIQSLLYQLDKIGPEDQSKSLYLLQENLLSTLPVALQRLYQLIDATPFREQDLPASLANRWHSRTGEYLVAVYPSGDIGDNESLRRFVRSVQQVAPHATGIPIISLEAGNAVIDAFIQAFSLTLVGVTIALLVMLRSIKYTVLVLLPLLLSSIFTGAFTVLLEIPFNFANIIALPLLLGLGIDSSLNIVHRSIGKQHESEILIHTSTPRAIFYSAFTTLVGFGSLMFSPHEGTASMGLLLTVGLAFTLICTLIILPSLLESTRQQQSVE
jgi:hopanoid biosynthesis associated RND transporter like protein HpnN